ncbi:phage DNA packaging protein J [Dietzia sp. SLG310A2-38A2]|nr:phage DNA packaging protein J [Dietzia sp. SLG310A2-38A2]
MERGLPADTARRGRPARPLQGAPGRRGGAAVWWVGGVAL